MNIILICFGGIIFAFVFFALRIIFQVIMYKRSCKSAHPTLPRRAHIRSHRNTAVGLPDNNFNWSVENSLPQALAIHKRILVNLNIMECQLARLEQFLSMRNRPSRTKHKRRVTLKLPEESDSASN